MKRTIQWIQIVAMAMGLAACGGGEDTSSAGLQSLRLLAAEAASTNVAESRSALQASGPLSTQPVVTADAFFDWAERAYPTTYPGNPANQVMAPYVYRYYTSTQTYLAVNGQLIYQVSPASGNQPVSLGKLADYTCRIYPLSCVPPPTGDTLAPTLTLLSPSTTGSYNSASASLTVSGTASDNVGVTSVGWGNSLGGSGAANLSGTATAVTWSAAAIALQAGTNTITITARDATGNSSSSTLVVIYGAPSAGSTYYVDAQALNDSGNGSAAAPKKYLSSGATLLSVTGGDTLIIKAGTYNHAKDLITSQGAGKPGAWNVIKAEVDGSVVITAGLALPLGDHYVQLEGLRWEGPSEKSINGRYVKVLRSAFKDGPATGNSVKLGIGTNDATPGAQYILIEDCQVYGAGGRYDLLVYNADKVVLRRVLARHGNGWTDTKGDPQGVVSLYNSTDVLTQNLLLVDSAASGYFESALYHPSNSRASRNIQNIGAIILNIAGSAVGWDDHVASSGNLLEDSVIWKATSAVSVNGAAHAGVLNRLTIGQISDYGLNDWSAGGRFNLKNSVLWAVNNNKFSALPHANNVCFAPACTGEATLDPATSGLRWLPYTGTGSALSTAGFGGSRSGATVLKRLGVSGTLWGDPGYNQTTAQDLWPWQNEAAIKKSMCTEVGITTGFCAKPSLTQYVWEQLGNAMPASFSLP